MRSAFDHVKSSEFDQMRKLQIGKLRASLAKRADWSNAPYISTLKNLH